MLGCARWACGISTETHATCQDGSASQGRIEQSEQARTRA